MHSVWPDALQICRAIEACFLSSIVLLFKKEDFDWSYVKYENSWNYKVYIGYGID